ncbi:hypothetical protein IJG22_03520, partial [Candidatus Saccharibacteria bacterium]|nr:hypothetical protein [Candidatus Saccharibacteria bacterium]
MKRKTNFFVSIGLLIACFLLSSHCNVHSASAYSASITTGSSINLDVSPAGDGTSIQNESINVQSDCRAGYNLTIATPQGSNLYRYENGTQADNTASFTAVDGAFSLSSPNNTNKWGYSLESNATSANLFSPLSSIATTLKTVSQTASPSSDINDTFPISFGIKADNTIAPGNYQMANQGAIVYYLTMDESCNVVDIAYDGNNADAGTMGAVGTGVIHTGVKDG